jgi:hypothetical protein
MKSPNPGGRSPAQIKLKKALECLAEDAGKRLRELLLDDDSRVALEATKFVIDHVVGKAPQAITNEDGGPLSFGVIILPAEK